MPRGPVPPARILLKTGARDRALLSILPQPIPPILQQNTMDHARRPRIVRAAVLHGARDMRYEKRLSVAPGPGEVSIAVRATGLCGSDRKLSSFECRV